MLLSVQIAISIENARLYQRLEHLNTTLEEQVQNEQRNWSSTPPTVSALMEQSRLEERNRIAGIHDTIGHTLTGVLMQVKLRRDWLLKTGGSANQNERL